MQTGKARAERPLGGGSKTSRSKRTGGQHNAPLLPFRSGRGGARSGSGRKPKIPGRPGVDHRERSPLANRFPVHVTLKLQSGLPRLRSRREYAALRAAFAAGCARNLAGTFRLCHYAVLNDHLHLLCESESRTALSRGLQGLLIRIAKALNKLWGPPRQRVRRSLPRPHPEVAARGPERAALPVRQRQEARRRRPRGPRAPGHRHVHLGAVVPRGFRERITVVGIEAVVRPVTDARTWLLTEGWLRHGRISVHEVPSTA
jgi:REP element-mobilizing transposase RayT